MVATVLVGMLCVHLLCFAVMFWLIGTRLQSQKLGMDAFALGVLLLAAAYVLQLLGGPPAADVMSFINHTLTVCVPLVFWLGGLRFLGRAAPLLGVLGLAALVYTLAQLLVEWLLGTVARYAMLSMVSATILGAMAVALLHAMRDGARDLQVEMALFALLVAGLAGLNAAKFWMVVRDGLAALGMGNRFQLVFYLYMSFLATVLAPGMVWLVLRRLTDELRATAGRDPLTQLLNRRGLMAGLNAHFLARNAAPARLLLLDIDHFKRVNDTHGHRAGDAVLCGVAEVLRSTLRRGDLSGRLGGEEFVAVCFGADEQAVGRLAERVRTAIAQHKVTMSSGDAPLRCTVTVGISPVFHSPDAMEAALQEADVALYRGKAGGRNRVEWGAPAAPGEGAAVAATP